MQRGGGVINTDCTFVQSGYLLQMEHLTKAGGGNALEHAVPLVASVVAVAGHHKDDLVFGKVNI